MMFAACAVGAAVVPAGVRVLAQGQAGTAAAPAKPKGSTAPPEQANVKPVNFLPNPYETVRNFGTLPNGRKWGSVSAVDIDPDGRSVWAADRCGTNSCAGSNVDPIVKLDPQGNVLKAFGAGQILWPHGMDVDKQGNVWVVDARIPTADELKKFPDWAKKGNTVTKFSPDGKVLLVLGTPGEAGDPPAKFTEPNDVVIGPDGSIYVSEAHSAQFIDAPEPGAIGRISKFSANGTFIKSFGSYGYGPSQFRGPHSLAFDPEGACSSPIVATVVSRSSTRRANCSTPGISSAASAAFTSTRTIPSMPSTRSRTITSILDGVRDCASAAPRRARSGSSCRSTCRSRRRAWADSDRWAKA